MDEDKSIQELADAVAEILRGEHQSDLEPFENYAERIKGDIRRGASEYRNRFVRGYVALQKKLSEERNIQPSQNQRIIRP